MKISIVYLTFRQDPKFRWFFDSLWNQYQTSIKKHSKLKLQLILIDGILWSSDKGVVKNRRNLVKDLANGRFPDLVHQSPKPSAFQGPYRKTDGSFFIAAGYRNTGACYAKHDFIVFVDDLSVLMPGWLNRVLACKRSGDYVVAGSYRKVNQMVVEDGKFVSGDIPDNCVDSRLTSVVSSGKNLVSIHGGELYGCSFGMPLKWYLKVNGQNELCDSLGGEDYDLGLRLERAGYQIKYDPKMLTHEANDLHSADGVDGLVERIDPRLTREEYLSVRRRFGLPGKPLFNVYDASHLILEMSRLKIDLWGKRSSLIGNYAINLAELRKFVLNGGDLNQRLGDGRSLPDRHFFTGQELSSLKTIDSVLREISMVVPKVEGWCSVEKAHEMARLVFLNQLRNCVELGVFAGRSTIPLAMALRDCCYPQGKIYGIDPWTKEAALEGSNDAANDEWWAKLDYTHWHRYTWSKVIEYGLESVMHLIRAKSCDVVDLFPDESLDLLHQDANHSEETSTDEVRRWASKVRTGGFWIFDDTNWKTTTKAQQMLVNEYGFIEVTDYQTWKVFQKISSKVIDIKIPVGGKLVVPSIYDDYPGSNVIRMTDQTGLWAKQETSLLIDVLSRLGDGSVDGVGGVDSGVGSGSRGVVIDVGSNVGYFSVIAMLYGYSVIAIEANQIHRQYLMKSISENQLDPGLLQYYEAFASDQTGTVSFDGWSGSDQIINQAKEYQVQTVKIDDLCSEAVFMKIDVEGAEPAVFRSAANLIGKVPYIMFELTYIIDNQVDSEQIGLLNLLIDRGYTCFNIGYRDISEIKDVEKRVAKWKKDFFEIHQVANPSIKHGGTNIIAVLKGHRVPNPNLLK